jgi:SAM-dependent methyltransferase
MSRTFSRPGESSPQIDKEGILKFFEQRAEKVEALGATRAVIYQDKDQDLAERRDAAEKTLLYPMLQLRPEDRVLDAGCGTGRWAEILIPQCAAYHGADLSPGLIKVAKNRFGAAVNAHFSVCSLDEISLQAIGETAPFSRILSVGVYIYLNDDAVLQALRSLAAVAAAEARIVFREPIGVNLRLTLDQHFSEDMEQHYSAIYRTEPELMAMFEASLGKVGFRLIDSGDVYADSELNNRAETKQRFFVFER